MTVTLDLLPDRVAALKAGIALGDAEAIGRILLEAPSQLITDTFDSNVSRVVLDRQSLEEYDRFVEEMDAELAGIFGRDIPELSDYAISREGIYGDHP